MAFFDITDRAHPTLKSETEVNRGPWHPVYSADGRYIYFGNKMANTITVMNASDGSIAKLIDGTERRAAARFSAVARWQVHLSSQTRMVTGPLRHPLAIRLTVRATSS